MSAAAPTGGLQIAALLRPEAYPHAVTTPIRLVETHVSWVLLTGDYAYKIKKPLHLDFLDYSTAERRRALCEEELRLNRRYAPGLYLDVCAIAGPGDSPRIGGAGPALDHAVRMRQFPARDELVSLLAADLAGEDELAQLGSDVARFHAAAARAPAVSTFGTPATVQRVCLDNVAELRRLPGTEPMEPALDELARGLGALHARRHPLLAARRQQGWIRECHGDLHCANVVRWQGRLTPFDGIEFDPALRFIDVVNDVAFLTMDLAERGRRDLRRAVLQAWTETLGDFAGLPLLAYYETYRALVRAKVAALRAVQASAAPGSRAEADTACARYLAWALRCLRGRRPALLLTCGLSGSGKTWLARQLAPSLLALHVRSDVERKRLAGLRPHEDSRSPPDGGIYTREFNARTYARLLDCARAALQGGETVVVDAAFLRRTERRAFLDAAVELGASAVILHCRAPMDLLRQRVAARRAAGNDPSEAGVELLTRQPAYFEDFADGERPAVVPVETGSSAALDDALGQLAARGFLDRD